IRLRRLPVVTEYITRLAQTNVAVRTEAVVTEIEPLQAAETILRRYGARAITILTNPRTLDDGRTLPARLSANDCYVAMEEACRKMARVALRKYLAVDDLRARGFAVALD